LLRLAALLLRSGGFMGQAKLEEAAEKYRRRIAELFGVPEEWIRKGPATRWMVGMVLAFVKPEHQEEVLRRLGLLGEG